MIGVTLLEDAIIIEGDHNKNVTVKESVTHSLNEE